MAVIGKLFSCLYLNPYFLILFLPLFCYSRGISQQLGERLAPPQHAIAVENCRALGRLLTWKYGDITKAENCKRIAACEPAYVWQIDPDKQISTTQPLPHSFSTSSGLAERLGGVKSKNQEIYGLS